MDGHKNKQCENCKVGITLIRSDISNFREAQSSGLLTMVLRIEVPRRSEGFRPSIATWCSFMGPFTIFWLAYAFSLPALRHPSTNERPTIYHLLRCGRPDQFGGTCTFLSASPVSRERH